MPDQFGNPLPGDLNLSQTNFGGVQDSSQGTFNPMAMFQPQVNQGNTFGATTSFDQSLTSPDAFFQGVDISGATPTQGGVQVPQQQEGGFFNNGQGGAGYGVQALGVASGLAQTFLGFEQLGVAKDQLAFQKNAWQEQFDIQKGEYDRRVSERNARVADNTASSQAAKQTALA